MAKVNEYIDKDTATNLFLEGLKTRLRDTIIREGEHQLYDTYRKIYQEQYAKLEQYANEVANNTIVDITSAQSVESAMFHYNVSVNIVKKDNEG